VGLTAAQAAQILDATPNAVYRLISRGALAKPVKHQHGGLQVDLRCAGQALTEGNPTDGLVPFCRVRVARGVPHR